MSGAPLPVPAPADSGPEPRRSVADTVYEALRARILSLDLPPGARLSEAEVAAEAKVSRQPVRDAFYRLSRQGFLTIRPQVATTVSAISIRQVREAHFLRTAIEMEILRTLCGQITESQIAGLHGILRRQEAAAIPGKRGEFHQLDDHFHRELARIAGHGHAWEVIRDLKAHMDRVRYLMLAWSSPTALAEHRTVLAAIEARDTTAAEAALRAHLGRVLDHLDKVRHDHAPLFGTEDV